MNLQFYFLVNIILISRLFFTFNDEPLNKKQTTAAIVILITGLLAYEIRFALAALAVIFTSLSILFHHLEKRLKKVNELRLLSLVIHLGVLSIFFSPSINLNFNPHVLSLFNSIRHYFLPFSLIGKVNWLKINILTMGFLLVTNEVNIIIRYLFQIFDLAPKKNVHIHERVIDNIDKHELNAGRLIGILERALIYYFVLNAHFSAVGFILAAKGFTRFKELEVREFAEYVLIGTLLSAVLAMVTAEIIQRLMP